MFQVNPVGPLLSYFGRNSVRPLKTRRFGPRFAGEKVVQFSDETFNQFRTRFLFFIDPLNQLQCSRPALALTHVLEQLFGNVIAAVAQTDDQTADILYVIERELRRLMLRPDEHFFARKPCAPPTSYVTTAGN